jgi:amino acid adenylation domain-containing protein
MSGKGPGATPSDGEKRARLAARLRERVAASRVQAPTHGQSGLLFMNQLAPESAAYNIAFAARVVSPLDAGALERAFSALMARHEVLRTIYATTDEGFRRRVLEGPALPFETFDASGLEGDALHEALRRSIEAPFDLQEGPVFRVHLYTRSPDDAFLVFAIHHIAMDGWSLWVCLDELAQLYHQALEGGPPSLPPVKTTFSDYAQSQRSLIDGPEGRRQRAHWLRRLDGELPVLDLSVDRVRPAVQRYRGDTCRFELGRELSGRLDALARGAGCTLQMAALALYQVMLHRYTGQEDLLVGSLASGRVRSELEDVVGYLANPITLRASIDGRASYRDVLARARETVLDGFDNQEYPFSSLVEELRPDRDASRSPVFQTMFVFEKPQRLEPEGASAFVLGKAGARMRLAGGLEFETLPFSAQQEGQFDLTLVAVEVGEVLHLALDYSTDLFEADTIRRMAGHYRRLARAVCEAPDAPIAELAMLTDAELEAIARWNATTAPLPDVTVHALFEQQSERQPAADAVALGDSRLSYRELDERANRLAHRLRDRGVGRDVPVGLCLTRSLDLPVAVLAVLKAGGAFLPLDPAYPVERLRFMLEDSGAPVVVTHEAAAGALPGSDAEIVLLEGEAEAIAACSRQAPKTDASPRDLAYVIYTSGSTGRPKGTLLEHRGLVNVALEQQRIFAVGPGSRVLQFSSLSFDASVFETAMALCAGGTLHLGSRESLLPGRPLLETLRSERINVITLPPSALLNVPIEALPDLDTVTVAGEACPAELVDRWAPGRAFFNLYGPTEATIWATYERCAANVPPTIGGPIANTRIHVLDRHRQPVPIGVPGELHIAGVGLARGYLDRPELTAERFLDDPFDPEAGGRLYETGDLVRRRADGRIEYLGRTDSQVKVRGFRIELGEIEAALGRHQDVNEVAVLLRDDLPSGRGLAAYVVPRAGRTVMPGALREHLRRALPEFMVPATFVALEAFPLTPNGKVDRDSLPAPDASRQAAEAFVAPDTEVTRRIARVWCEALGLDRVGVHDNFFDLGGNSLLIAQVSARLAVALGQDVPVVDLFRFPTVGELASRVGRSDTDAPSLATADRGDALRAGRARLLERRGRKREGGAP